MVKRNIFIDRDRQRDRQRDRNRWIKAEKDTEKERDGI
jgi:hypothetical protein